MYCNKCGAQVSNNARFCGKCGATIVHQRQGPRPMPAPAGQAHQTARIVEGVLSAILAPVVLFAPTIEISFFSTHGISIADILLRFKTISSYLGEKYTFYLVLLLMYAVTAAICSAYNAAHCFNVGSAKKYEPQTCWAVATYAFVMLLLLMYLSHETYGIGGASGWVWFMLFGGIVNGVLDFQSRNASPRTKAL